MSKAISKPRLPAIEYIRGISMMGVIGIHIGSQYLANTSANMHLVALFEIATRFSVPIFFFISAFGLFYNLNMAEPFNYRHFLTKRFKAVLVPYLVWSLFYLWHDGILYGVGFPSPLSLIEILFFGNAKYQLYFLVILLWFYLLMPLWIAMVKNATKALLLALIIFQFAFDYWSSFSVSFNTFVYALPDSSFLKPFLMYRLNYWVLHYIFIFVLGGYLAVHINSFMLFMKKQRHIISLCFLVSLLSLLGYYYDIIYADGYTLLEAINTAHQLSPAGIFYTIAASIFFFTIFTFNNFSDRLKNYLHILGFHSYFAYLVHPLVITYLSMLLASTNHLMTAPISMLFYIATLLLSLLLAAICRKIGNSFPLLNKLTIGIFPKAK